jgi:hypothetical protein
VVRYPPERYPHGSYRNKQGDWKYRTDFDHIQPNTKIRITMGSMYRPERFTVWVQEKHVGLSNRDSYLMVRVQEGPGQNEMKLFKDDVNIAKPEEYVDLGYVEVQYLSPAEGGPKTPRNPERFSMLYWDGFFRDHRRQAYCHPWIRHMHGLPTGRLESRLREMNLLGWHHMKRQIQHAQEEAIKDFGMDQEEAASAARAVVVEAHFGLEQLVHAISEMLFRIVQIRDGLMNNNRGLRTKAEDELWENADKRFRRGS